MTNTNNKKTMKKKLISAIAMLTVSAVTLSTATYAWFTMNKEVSVVGMQMKAHAEEGLLINEVADAGSNYWDEQADAGDNAYNALRPASTKNLANWWHANSKKSANEAGYGSGAVDATNTVEVSDGKYYTNISNITAYTTNEDGDEGAAAERTVFFENATFGTNNGSGAAGYDDGEGFYAKYTYYLKSSNTSELNIAADKLMAKVTATKDNGSGTSTDLDKALRVGIMYQGNYMIFAPVSGANAKYSVTGSDAGEDYYELDSTKTATTRYTVSTDYVAINNAAVTVPDVNTDGEPVYVYVWFEGEDTNCKSDNITANLDEYSIRIDFKDDAL